MNVEDLDIAGRRYAAARARLAQMRAEVDAAVKSAAADGTSETEIARRVGVDRMTVRKTLGKRTSLVLAALLAAVVLGGCSTKAAESTPAVATETVTASAAPAPTPAAPTPVSQAQTEASAAQAKAQAQAKAVAEAQARDKINADREQQNKADAAQAKANEAQAQARAEANLAQKYPTLARLVSILSKIKGCEIPKDTKAGRLVENTDYATCTMNSDSKSRLVEIRIVEMSPDSLKGWHSEARRGVIIGPDFMVIVAGATNLSDSKIDVKEIADQVGGTLQPSA